jgi:hypothetical protein
MQQESANLMNENRLKGTLQVALVKSSPTYLRGRSGIVDSVQPLRDSP